MTEHFDGSMVSRPLAPHQESEERKLAQAVGDLWRAVMHLDACGIDCSDLMAAAKQMDARRGELAARRMLGGGL